MRTIEILDGGLLTTVQDRGRFRYQRYGVPVSGAMDTVALRVANRLAGNPEGAAALEMTLLGPQLRFLAPTRIALAGGDLGAVLDGRTIPSWAAAAVSSGETLSFDGAKSGIRGYLAVAGGIDVPIVLGSRSTYLRSKLGGYEGRALAAGDVLEAPGVGHSHHVWLAAMQDETHPVYGHDHELRVVLGPQDDRFTAGGLRTFLTSTYSVTPRSDRMGCRLAGPPIEHLSGADIVSDGSPLGAVQVSGDGQPIVLMADRGTAGGYTKIATVISVDVCRLAQAAPGDAIRFKAVSVAEAHDALREQEAWIRGVATPGGTGQDATRRKKAAAAVAAVAQHINSRQ